MTRMPRGPRGAQRDARTFALFAAEGHDEHGAATTDGALPSPGTPADLGVVSAAVPDARAEWLARKLPAAMLFVPSIGGISHHWSENTSDEDIVLGAQVFTDAILNVIQTSEGAAALLKRNMSGS